MDSEDIMALMIGAFTAYAAYRIGKMSDDVKPRQRRKQNGSKRRKPNIVRK